jgi:hypothetical protein
MSESTEKKRISIADLYPELSPAEQAEAEYNLKRYLNLVWRIYERVRREDPELLTKTLNEARLMRTENNSPAESEI